MSSAGLLSLQAALEANNLAPSQQTALLQALASAIAVFDEPDDRTVTSQFQAVAEAWATSLYALDAAGAVPTPPPLFVLVDSGSGVLVPGGVEGLVLGPYAIAPQGLGVNITPTDLSFGGTAAWGTGQEVTWRFENTGTPPGTISVRVLSAFDRHVNFTVFRKGV